MNTKKQQPTWDVAAFRTAMIANACGDRFAALTPSLDSIVLRHKYARYHYDNVMDLLGEYDSHFKPIPDKVRRNIRLLMRNQNGYPFEISIGAHVVGICQCLHAITDLLSVVIHHTLSLPVVAGEYINEGSVKAALKRKITEDSRYQKLKCLFDNIGGDKNYKYLDLITNWAKHEKVVEPILCRDTGKLYFPAFSAATGDEQEKDVNDFLTAMFNGTERRFIAIGIELNIIINASSTQ